MSLDASVTSDLMSALHDCQEDLDRAAKVLGEDGQTEAAETMRTLSTHRSRQYMELRALASVLGEDVSDSSSVLAGLRRQWVQAKATITGGADAASVVAAVRKEEEHLADAYRQALEEDISADLRSVVERQRADAERERAVLESVAGD